MIRLRKNNIKSVVIVFEDGLEILVTEPQNAQFTHRTNIDSEKFKPRYEWDEFELKWSTNPNPTGRPIIE